MGILGGDGAGRKRAADVQDVARDRHECGREKPRESTADDSGVRDHGHQKGMDDVPGSGEVGSHDKNNVTVIEKGLDSLEQAAQQCRCDVMIISQNPLSQHEVAELFSISRVSKAEAVGLKCGPSYDILSGVDLREKRECECETSCD